ncbi:MAG: McrC family protein [Bacteroidales bacterium]|jgi:5-methylcytosine-specific restriction enzyme subunit McrC|nr:McrC family protein [Bacteroidales bacterium]MCI1733269.1 McrC family protein [Bacteroidales bacterium]
MRTTKVIHEHDCFPDKVSYLKYDSRLGNGFPLFPPGTSDFNQRYFIQWEGLDNKPGYRASYMIGAQWINTEHDQIPVAVVPKIEHIDFLKMFMSCFYSNLAEDSFSKIYHIDTSKKEIECQELDSILSPLIVLHFLAVTKSLIAKGLKKDYVNRDGNMHKVKGRLDIRKNEKTNVLTRRLDRFYCNYQEYSEDIPENRIIKKALIISQVILQKIQPQQSEGAINILRKCLAVMSGVGNTIEQHEVSMIKHHKLFKEYEESIKLAKLILKRYDFSITKEGKNHDFVPVFWIDMPLLYEHYVYGLLSASYPDDIIYQAEGQTGYPDFLCKSHKLILDTKYIPDSDIHLDTYVIRQLSGYARDNAILNQLNADYKEVVPCVIIYPKESVDNEVVNDFNKPLNKLWTQYEGLVEFYTICVNLPNIVKR